MGDGVRAGKQPSPHPFSSPAIVQHLFAHRTSCSIRYESLIVGRLCQTPNRLWRFTETPYNRSALARTSCAATSVSIAGAILMTTNLLVGVFERSATLLIGTRTLPSGK